MLVHISNHWTEYIFGIAKKTLLFSVTNAFSLRHNITSIYLNVLVSYEKNERES